MRDPDQGFDYRITLWLCICTAVGLVPFTLAHIIGADWRMAGSTGALVVLLAASALYIHRRRRAARVNMLLALAGNLTVLWAVHHLGVPGVHWVYPLMLVNFYILPLRLAVPVSALATVATLALVWAVAGNLHLPRIIGALLMVVAFAYIFSRAVEKQRRALLHLTRIDPLTGAGNRRALAEAGESVTAAGQRYGSRSALIVLDLDHFKDINDRYGHDAGDAVLMEVAANVQARLRRSDQLFRFGGEEFIVLVPQAGQAAALELAEQLRRMVEALSLEAAPGLSLSFSGGVAELRPGESWPQWVKRADQAMYRAKRAGRNRVESADPLDAPRLIDAKDVVGE